MMEMLILNYALCLIEYTAFFVFFNSLLEKRIYKISIPLLLAILSGSVLIFSFSELNMWIKSLLNFLILVLGSSLLYKGKIIIKCTYSLMLLFILSIIDIILGNLFAVVMSEDYSAIFYSNIIYRLAFCLTIKVIDIIVLAFMQRAFKHIDKNLNSKYWGLLGSIFLVLLSTSVVFLDFYLEAHQNRETLLLFLLISSAFFVLSIIVIYFFTEICAGVQRDKRLFSLEINNRALEEALAMQNSNTENLRKIRHDITKHTANAVALIESGNADEAAALLKNAGENSLKILPRYNVNTGNNVVDAIISSKATLCESKGIAFSYKIEPLEEIKIETADLSSLLSNLLDNAIEAAQQTESGYIKIQIFKYKAYYEICVENSFMGKNSIVHSGFHLLSTKSNSVMHGYGTQIIEDIARKYDGDSTWNADGESFKSNVLLKI